MAVQTIKSTYSLDFETVRTLSELADRWQVSKSEAMRRAIRGAAERERTIPSRLEAFDQLVKSMKLTRKQADAWMKRVRDERRASSRKRLAWLK